MAIVFQTSVIFVKEIQTARNFYETLLGQQVVMDHGPNVAFAGGFALWAVDHAHEMIFETATKSVPQLGHDNCELYFETVELEDVLEQLTNAGVKFVHALREHPWGQRALRCYDPDGHIVEIGEPMPAVMRRFFAQGLSVPEVAERTSMPLDIVKQVHNSMKAD